MAYGNDDYTNKPNTATSVPLGGVTGLGTGVATALAVNVGSAGAPLVNGGVLGTPSSGTGTNITAIPTANLLTSSTNDSAAAGKIGEYVSGSTAVASPVSLTTNTAANITSISLTAGDWDVWGTIGFTGNSATLVTYLLGVATQTSATMTNADSFSSQIYGSSGLAVFAVAEQVFNIPQTRVSLSGTTTIYLVGQAGFSVSTASGFGRLHARRVR